MTSNFAPEQHEGTVADGSKFYFRYRAGYASLGIGDTDDDAVKDPFTVGMSVGAPLQGSFASQSQRDTVFQVLMNKYLGDSGERGDAG